MVQTRREFLAGLSAAAGLIAAGPVWASTKVGTMQIDTLSDGNLVLPGDFIFGPMLKDDLAPIIAKYDLSTETLTPECNLTLMRNGSRIVLFDVGAGPDFQPSAGKLMEAFDAIGLDPYDVTDVVVTHGHPDHIWGLMDDFGDPMFPMAEYYIGDREFYYWMDDTTVDTIGTARQSFAVGAKRRFEAIAQRVITFRDGEEILPGVRAHASFGHTPGHMAFELRSGSESLMVVGDAIGNHHVAFEHPSWASGSDQDPELAAYSRKVLFEMITAEKMRMIGFHLPGGLGHVDTHGDGYIFVEESA
ncbi:MULTISPECIES: MBL fold metallo-hydrolase [unclassified Marinovum]